MKVAVMGYGTVGRGVVKVLKMNEESIAEKSVNGKIEVKYILDIKEITDENAHLVTKNFDDILCDDEIKVVVETMGGLNPAFKFVSECLKKGKSVVSSNKELVAEKGLELMKIASENGAMFEFEASVGGGIPVIRAITDSLNSNEITDVAGIINGTTNFILTKMVNEGAAYADVLKEAQALGYAEKDPTADVEGLDAGRKICILSALAFGKHVYPDKVHTEGITSIKLEDVALADKLGCVIKLIARAKREEDGISVMVSPALLSKSSPLAFVSGVNNAVLVRGNAVGDVMLYGPGAGMLPTASAVVSDIIDCCNKSGSDKKIDMFWKEEAPEGFIKDYLEAKTSLFVRGGFKEAEVKAVFGDIGDIYAGEEETAFITPKKTEKELRESLSRLGSVNSVLRKLDY
ncbi:MAG: homoserine dehydrogenase [Acutalibacteraceae bacterium]